MGTWSSSRNHMISPKYQMYWLNRLHHMYPVTLMIIYPLFYCSILICWCSLMYLIITWLISTPTKTWKWRLSALLQLHHSRLNTWLQWIGQRQLQDDTRNIEGLGLGVHYISGLIIRYMWNNSWNQFRYKCMKVSDIQKTSKACKIPRTKPPNSFLQCSQMFHRGIWMIKYVQTYCQLSKLMARDMPVKTKLTSLVNMRGLIDSASLENHHNNSRNSGG